MHWENVPQFNFNDGVFFPVHYAVGLSVSYNNNNGLHFGGAEEYSAEQQA